MPVFRHRTELDFPPEQVFEWHENPGALERLTPPWVPVRLRERTPGIQDGARVLLEVGPPPMRIGWELRHTGYQKGKRFVDEQVSGPFQSWRHEHRFEPRGAGESVVEDVVQWAAPLGALGEVLSDVFVERSLVRAFRFRARRLAGDLGLHARYGWGEGRVVAVTGSSGFVGRNLTALLRSGGYRVREVSRSSRSSSDSIRWDPEAGVLDPVELEGVYAVVHLAGEPISGVRWTAGKKESILRSREAGTRLLTRTLGELTHPPEVLVVSSAVGYYGDRGDALLTEASGPGSGFLAEVCTRWEAAADPARAAGIRTVHLRTGVVLSPAGGMLGTTALPFRMGLGGRIGSGRQYMSWIDLDDLTGLILHAIRSKEVRGALNGTAPNPVPNSAFTDILGRVLRRPTVLPVPAAAVRALLGQMGKELLLYGQRALPEKGLASGYRFLYPDLEDSLRHQFGADDDAVDAESEGLEP
jgi:uncharacterized protein